MSSPHATEISHLPFYPNSQYEEKYNVGVWWFEKDFSQSRYGYDNGKGGSNACTLITLLVAQKTGTKKIQLFCTEPRPNPDLVVALADGIIEGNEIHDTLLGAGMLSHVNMTIPEALSGGRPQLKGLKEWKSLIFLLDLGDTLYNQLKDGLRVWWGTTLGKSLDFIFVVLICDNRSILFIFQKSLETAVLIDSHRHLDHGSVIACAPFTNLNHLCHWHKHMLRHCYNSRPDCYELSFLYVRPRSAHSRPSSGNKHAQDI